MYGKVFDSLWNGSLRGDAAAQLVLIYLVCNANVEDVADIIAFQYGARPPQPAARNPEMPQRASTRAPPTGSPGTLPDLVGELD